jgi:hypothetical protein
MHRKPRKRRPLPTVRTTVDAICFRRRTDMLTAPARERFGQLFIDPRWIVTDWRGWVAPDSDAGTNE